MSCRVSLCATLPCIRSNCSNNLDALQIRSGGFRCLMYFRDQERCVSFRQNEHVLLRCWKKATCCEQLWTWSDCGWIALNLDWVRKSTLEEWPSQQSNDHDFSSAMEDDGQTVREQPDCYFYYNSNCNKVSSSAFLSSESMCLVVPSCESILFCFHSAALIC